MPLVIVICIGDAFLLTTFLKAYCLQPHRLSEIFPLALLSSHHSHYYSKGSLPVEDNPITNGHHRVAWIYRQGSVA